MCAPQDVRKLIEFTGGEETFVQRLDKIFYRQRFDVTNEPGFLIPTLYDGALRPDETAHVMNALLEKAPPTSILESRGSDDSGAMSSLFVFNSLGFHPNASQPVYVLGTPGFTDATLAVGYGKRLHILARNLDTDTSTATCSL